MASFKYTVAERFISEEELIEIESLLERTKNSESKAADLCKAWMEQREKTIETVDCLEKTFDKYHRTCCAAQGAGAAMEVVGGVALVAGAILTACGHKSIGEFLTKKVSPVTVGTGVATSVSSSLLDLGLTVSTMNNVKTVLKKDEVYTELLMKHLHDAKKIDAYFRKVYNCSVFSNNFLDVVQLVREGISLLEVGYVEFSKLWVELKSRAVKALKCRDISDYSETVLQNVYTTMKKIANNANTRKAVKNMCCIIQQSPSTIEFIKLGLRISIQICDVLNVDIFTPLLGLAILKTSTGVMATQCLLGSILVAANVLSVISASKNVKQESSKYSEMLKKLNLALTMELNNVRKYYSNLP